MFVILAGTSVIGRIAALSSHRSGSHLLSFHSNSTISEWK